MTREMKIALIVGFLLVLFVTVLISDHLSKARQSRLEPAVAMQPPLAPPITMAPPTQTPIVGSPVEAVGAGPVLPSDAPASTVGAASPPKPADPVFADPPMKPVELTIARGASGVSAIRDTRFPTSPIRGPVAMDTRSEPAGGPSADPTRPAPARVAGAEHVVAEGESAYRIAKDSYGDGGLWRKLVAFNPDAMTSDGTIRVGAKLVLPPKDVLLGQAKPADSKIDVKSKTAKPDADGVKPVRVAQGGTIAAPGRTASAKGRTYVVQKGDTLGDIARKELGTSKRANDILRQNAGTLKDPGSMQPGMVLTLPNA